MDATPNETLGAVLEGRHDAARPTDRVRAAAEPGAPWVDAEPGS